jgi:hypothetical protein
MGGVMNKKERVDKLQKLQAHQAATAATAQKLQKSITVIKRKQDLQRKILVGSYYLEQAKNKGATQELQKIMLSYLKKDSDRKLFKQTE